MRSERLLILDDDPDIGRMIGLMAKGAGLQHRAVTRPVEFFHQLESWKPTHIVLDLVMPEMDGVEIMRRLAERACTASIIISSGVEGRVRDAAERAAAAHSLNVVGALSKPFRARQLREIVGKFGPGDTDRENEGASGDGFEVTEADIRRAIEMREFHLEYQPKIDCTTRALVGFEALVRWNHPNAGLVMPDRFIPLAESAGLIDRLTETILDHGLRWMTGVQAGDASTGKLSLAINLSARTLADFRFADHLSALCRELEFEPGRLTLELTETAAMEDPVLALDMMTRLRMKGVRLSIDDFGTGYSSMLQLARLPFSEIKIDKSFVMSASGSKESRVIIKSIIDLAHNLGLKAVAEGVEDDDTLELLREVGCDVAQGFYIARPMTGVDALKWIAGRQPASSTIAGTTG